MKYLKQKILKKEFFIGASLGAKTIFLKWVFIKIFYTEITEA